MFGRINSPRYLGSRVEAVSGPGAGPLAVACVGPWCARGQVDYSYTFGGGVWTPPNWAALAGSSSTAVQPPPADTDSGTDGALRGDSVSVGLTGETPLAQLQAAGYNASDLGTVQASVTACFALAGAGC